MDEIKCVESRWSPAAFTDFQASLDPFFVWTGSGVLHKNCSSMSQLSNDTKYTSNGGLQLQLWSKYWDCSMASLSRHARSSISLSIRLLAKLGLELFMEVVELCLSFPTRQRTPQSELCSSSYGQNTNSCRIRKKNELERSKLSGLNWSARKCSGVFLGTKFSVHSLPLFTYFLFNSIGDDYPPILL